MATAKKPGKVKLFTGIIYPETINIEHLFMRFQSKFGVIDMHSEIIPFSHTDYYDEMGENLVKIFISFKKLVNREKIASIKIFTNGLESEFSKGGKRIFNIDPGYMTLSNVFLASCKDFYHRVYLKKGVYLENEYYYSSKQFNFWPWTYPDYKKKEYLDFFYSLRKMYHEDLRKMNR